MKRCKLGFWLLAVLLGLGALTTWGIQKDLGPITGKLEEASRLALREDWAGAMELARVARNQWEDCWPRTAALSNHTPMEEADQWFARLEVYARAGDTLRYADGCTQLAELLRTLWQAHSLNLRNLL